MTKYEPSERDIRQVSSPTAVRELGTMPIQCPECMLAVQEAGRKGKELLAQNEAALVAHKEHGKFLQTQLDKSARDSALNEVFKKLFEDCAFLQAGKVVDILLAQDREFDKADCERLRMIKAAAENLKILESAAQIQWQRKAARVGVTSKETEQMLSNLKSRVDLNHSISTSFPNHGYEVDTGRHSSNQDKVEASRCWKTAVNLAKIIKLDRRT